jgi:signal peptidase II
MLQGSAQAFAVVTVAVVAVLVALEARTAWRSWLLTLALALLLGGAIGNFVDRMRFGYVVDFVDIGIGTWRFYIFNIADSAVTVSVLVLLLLWFATPTLERREDADPGEGKPLEGAGSPGIGDGPAVG